MSLQTTLTETAPLTLDATCSEMKIWPRFASLRMDIRRAAAPDIIASAALLPFRPGIFSIIYIDPPFELSRRKRGIRRLDKGFLKRMERYGNWGSRANWENFLKGVDAEFSLCLAPRGRVFFKLMDSKEDCKFDDLKQLTSFNIKISKKWKSKAAQWGGKVAAPVAIFELTPRGGQS